MPANTTVLVITFKADRRRTAQSGSHAFAEAYLRNRQESAQNGLDQQIKTLNAKVKQLTTTLTGINARLARAAEGQPGREQPAEPAQQLAEPAELADRQAERADHDHGRCRQHHQRRPPAGHPDQPQRDDQPRHRRHGRAAARAGAGVRPGALRPAAAQRRRRAATGAGWPCWPPWTSGPHRTSTTCSSRTAPGGRVFNRLRNEILASLRPGDQVIVVTGASRGSAATLVAANLAAALARTGSDVVLIGAHLPDSVVDAAPLARMLGVSAMPGLSDLLAGRVSLARALQRTPRIPSLRVITTGGAATRGRPDAVAAAQGHPGGAAPAGRLRGDRGAVDQQQRRRAEPGQPRRRGDPRGRAAPVAPARPCWTRPSSCTGSAPRCSARSCCRGCPACAAPT